MSFFIARFDPAMKYGAYKQFDCQYHAINKYVSDSLKRQVKLGLCVAYALLEDVQGGPRFAGFFTIVNHTVALSSLATLQLAGLPKTIPCVRVIMLGVHHTDAGQGLGQKLMNHALDITKLSAQSIGCFGLYLDADAGAVKFYQKLGFVLLEGDKSPAPSPMFIPMSAIP